MCKRLLAVFLAFVLLWSGATAHESLLLPATAQAAASMLATDDGSVTDHHLDDQPVQSLGDAPTDTPALPCAALRLPAKPAVPATSSAHRPTSWASHVPEGPRRPPRLRLQAPQAAG